jgi:hypothetical protein
MRTVPGSANTGVATAHFAVTLPNPFYNPVMAVLGLDPRINPAISTRTDLTKDVVPAIGNPIRTAG